MSLWATSIFDPVVPGIGSKKDDFEDLGVAQLWRLPVGDLLAKLLNEGLDHELQLVALGHGQVIKTLGPRHSLGVSPVPGLGNQKFKLTLLIKTLVDRHASPPRNVAPESLDYPN